MDYFIITILPWIMSASTIVGSLMLGSMHRASWIVGLINQAMWCIWTVYTHNWGLLPLNVFLTGIYIRNHILWARARAAA